jgi:hypothetical protein
MRWGCRMAYRLLRREVWTRADNGPEFIAQTLRDWCAVSGTTTMACIEPGSPWEIVFAESFNCRFWDEFLNMELFTTAPEAQILAELPHDRKYPFFRPGPIKGGSPGPCPGGQGAIEDLRGFSAIRRRRQGLVLAAQLLMQPFNLQLLGLVALFRVLLLGHRMPSSWAISATLWR